MSARLGNSSVSPWESGQGGERRLPEQAARPLPPKTRTAVPRGNTFCFDEEKPAKMPGNRLAGRLRQFPHKWHPALW
jgi:hypothetical protein